MSKPSQLVLEIYSEARFLRAISKERLDGELRNRIEKELVDAARLVREAVDAVKEALEEPASLDRSG